MNTKRPTAAWRRSPRRMSGMSIIEMMVWLMIVSVGSTVFMRDRADTAREARGKLIATSMAPYNQALYDYVQKYRDNIVYVQPITGVANPLAPTIAELQALQIFPSTYPLTIPTNGGNPIYSVARIPTGCVAAACDIAFQFTNSLPELDSSGKAAEGVLGTATRYLGSSAGYSSNVTPATIDFRGGFSLANPQGSTAGIIATYNTWSASGSANFVRVGDTRDPVLQGPFTAAGAATLNGGATINGGDLNVPSNNLNVNCFRVQGTTGRVGTNCLDPADMPSGWSGGVRTRDIAANGSVLAWDSTGPQPLSAMGTAGTSSPSVAKAAGMNYSMLTQSGVWATGVVVADRLVPYNKYNIGDACTDDGAIAQSNGAAGYVGCIGGAWRDLLTYGTEGSSCAQPGYFMKASDGTQLVCVGGGAAGSKLVRLDRMLHAASIGQDCSSAALGTTAYNIDVGNGTTFYATLICRQNPLGGSPKYMRLQDLTTNISFAGAVEVTNGTTVTKPSCPKLDATQTVIPVPQMAGKAYSSSDGGVNMLVSDNGASWTAILQNGAGAPLTGNPSARAVLQMYCYYP